MDLDIFNLAGEKTGIFSMDPAALGAPVSRVLMHRAVVSYEANLRQGTASAKTRGEVAGSGSKPWKQKHTGRARVGSIRNPVWRGGGVIFPPKPRDYRMKLSKKEKDIALRGALQGKVQDREVCVIEALAFAAEPKTKLVSGFLRKAGIKGRVLFVSKGLNLGWLRGSRNIQDVELLPLKDLNALAVLKGRTLVFEKAAIEELVKGAK